MFVPLSRDRFRGRLSGCISLQTKMPCQAQLTGASLCTLLAGQGESFVVPHGCLAAGATVQLSEARMNTKGVHAA